MTEEESTQVTPDRWDADVAGARIAALEAALQKMWTFAGDMQTKHGEDGDASMTDAEHEAWRDAGYAANSLLARKSQPAEELPIQLTLAHFDGIHVDEARDTRQVPMTRFQLQDVVDQAVKVVMLNRLGAEGEFDEAVAELDEALGATAAISLDDREAQPAHPSPFKRFEVTFATRRGGVGTTYVNDAPDEFYARRAVAARPDYDLFINPPERAGRRLMLGMRHRLWLMRPCGLRTPSRCGRLWSRLRSNSVALRTPTTSAQ